ncbi:MAG: D-2-hydroxyacid dehydrogenase [Bacteroidia bacterium]
MVKILANDGIAPEGQAILEDAGFEVDTNKIPQEELTGRLNGYDAIIVRSATLVTKEVIDSAPNLKAIGRAGVGLDNIDVAHARRKGIEVINTPDASSLSVAELVFAHIFTMSRFLHLSNHEMRTGGEFKALKKKYSKGIELREKTLGIIGLGRIGQETAKIALGLGMEVVAFDPQVKRVFLDMDHLDITPTPEMVIETTSKEEVLERCDFLTLHVPFKAGSDSLLSKKDFSLMKNTVIVINCSRGGVVHEQELIEALDQKQIAFAGLDVFENEPVVNPALLGHQNISVSPHIGGSTIEAQERVGVEIAKKIVRHFQG